MHDGNTTVRATSLYKKALLTKLSGILGDDPVDVNYDFLHGAAFMAPAAGGLLASGILDRKPTDIDLHSIYNFGGGLSASKWKDLLSDPAADFSFLNSMDDGHFLNIGKHIRSVGETGIDDFLRAIPTSSRAEQLVPILRDNMLSSIDDVIRRKAKYNALLGTGVGLLAGLPIVLG